MRWHLWWWASTLLTVAIVAGCDDGEPPNGGVSGGAGGTAGSSAGGNAGSSGRAGAAGSSGASGAGGAAGSACAPEPAVSEEELARAVVVLNSCLSDDGYLRTQTHLRSRVGGYSYAGGSCFTKCLSQVTTGCDGVRQCFGLSDRQPSDPCNACQGNVAIVCGDVEARWDCSKFSGTCSAGRCIAADRKACDELTFRDHCDAEGRPVHCDDMLQLGPVCADFGLACRQETFSARCVGTGAACTAPEFAYFDVAYSGLGCSGGRLQACVRGGLAELDCSLFAPDFSCQSSGGAFFCGTASECDPATHVKSCEGTSSVICNAGKLFRVDCAAHGFTACSANSRLGCE